MGKKRQTFYSTDKKLELQVYSDGSLAEMKFSENNDLVSPKEIIELLSEARIVYGFENAKDHCKKNGIDRKQGEYFPVAMADDVSFHPEVEVLLDPLDCLLSQRLYSLNDLSRVRHINTGEKLAKVKVGSGGSKSKNIFGHEIRDLSTDKNFTDTYLGSNVEFDKRRNLIVAAGDGYGIVENDKKINIVDNIFLQQDIIEAGYEVKTSLTLDGSIFKSDLVVNGNLIVHGKIENCREKGIIVTGDMNLESAEDSLLICKGKIRFREELKSCKLFCNGVLEGDEGSLINGGIIQSGLAIEADRIGDEEGGQTVAEIGLSPFIKGMMIQLTQELRRKGWDPALPDMDDPMVKELSQLEIRFSKQIPDFLSNHRSENKICSRQGFGENTYLRIFNLSWNLDEETNEQEFSLVQE